MKTKEFTLVGTTYSIAFKSVKERNEFKKMSKQIFKQIESNPEYENKTALMDSICIAMAKKMNLNMASA